MGNKHSWGAVPNLVKQVLEFETATPEYAASLCGIANIEKSARQILTRLKTSYSTHDPIYLVGHSLGGLVAREICRQLLVEDPNGLLTRIAAVITVGTPLSGARFGNMILRLVPFPKVQEIGNSKPVFDAYREAIRNADSKRFRPKHFHIEIESDGVIAAHKKSGFTEDDRDGGVIPGSHRNFASSNDAAAYVADVILKRIHEVQNSRGRPYMTPAATVVTTDLPDRLIVIACSHGKTPGGGRHGCPTPLAWIGEQGLRRRFLSKRSYVFSTLKDAKIADGFERGGNRAHQPANSTLTHAFDFGGTAPAAVDALYLPAWKRYSGRTYAPVSENSWQNYFQNRNRMRVLIMSGLYGLIEPEECIQNYDVHLSDSHTESGQSVGSMWSDLFTDGLASYVRHAYRDRRVKIFNLLCDRYYVDSIHWHALPKECSVYHLASPTLADVELLPPAGTILNSFLADPNMLETVEQDSETYELSKFGQPPTGLSDVRVIFEGKIGNSRPASR